MPRAAGARTDSGGLNPLETVRVLRSAGGALLAQAVLHGQLVLLEWEEEKSRLLKVLVTTLAGFACLLCVLLFSGAVVIGATWETAWRIPALLALSLLYGCGVALAWRRLRAWSAASGDSFAASRAELAADAALLRARL